MSSTTQRLLFLAILAFGVLLRISVALYLGDTVPTGKDEQAYSELAAGPRLQLRPALVSLRGGGWVSWGRCAVWHNARVNDRDK